MLLTFQPRYFGVKKQIAANMISVLAFPNIGSNVMLGEFGGVYEREIMGILRLQTPILFCWKRGLRVLGKIMLFISFFDREGS